MVDDRGEAAVVADLDEEYEILAELGRGGSAVVYRARDRALGRDVAIKVVRGRPDGLDAELIARLGREARMVAQLQHPQIVSVHAVKRLPDGLALIMQWVPGRTLKQTILEEGPLAPARAEALLRDIASALAYAHAHGVIHRDVKPENIFLDAVSGRALLSDFGIAFSREFDSRLTMTGTAIGTPTYMAPEQIDGAAADARSDVYSLGLVAWEMLTGHRPWEGDSLYNVMYRQKNEALRPIDDVRSDVPERLQYLIERALQKRPGARWAGADGLLAQLQGSVLPPDWVHWRVAHQRRQEVRAAEREARRRAPHDGAAAAHGAAPVGLFAAALQTIRFRRPESGAEPFTPTSNSERSIALVESSALAAPAVINTGAANTNSGANVANDDQPTWMQGGNDEVDIVSPSRGRRWVALGVAVVALLALIGAWRVLGTPAEIGRSDSASISTLSDVAARELPVGLPIAPPVGDSSSDSSSDSLSATLDVAPDDSVSNAVVPPPAPTNVLPRARPIEPTLPGPVLAGAPPVAPVPVEPSLRATSDPGIVAAGGRHSCVVHDARLTCWGANDDGQLGSGGFDDASFPGSVRGEFQFTQVSSGLSHTCALAREGDVYCWGSDAFGQLGDATRTSRSAPVRVASNLLFMAIRAGRDHSCALTTDGVVVCWGSNARGQLGDGTTIARATPTAAATSLRFIAATAGWQHSCGLTRDGAAICWGDNASGQLGDGTVVSRATPLPVTSAMRFTSIAAGSNQTCAISTLGSLWCWGRDGAGSSPGTPRTEPTRVASAAAFTSVVAGTVHVCARSTSGEAWCMGRNGYGQLGDGTTVDRNVPVKVLAPLPFTSLSANGAHTCGVLTSGETMCWGYNIDGQLGDGTRNNQPRPVRVGTPR
ncbi:protein kinase domain-containing protein [Gemmatimonas groenlandica]|uniref:non-specific serine/threonine protein kinase n=1 Tax=Gemmatimonas groenlandica TaxID=2732249 RepID=A0A6M4IR66_9BACT|nr:protein kinase [Gemmatimonas groenlandica]QJR34731.1 protein kinase [Gemmatimonas groenlandica]